MNRTKLILLMLAMLLLGAAGGVTGTLLLIRHRLTRPAAEGQPAVRHRMMRSLVRQLDLDDAQRDEIEAILADAQQRLADLRADVRPQVQAVFQETFEKMSEHLTPEQVEKAKQLQTRWRRNLRHMGEGDMRPPPHGGPGRSSPPPSDRGPRRD